MILRVEVETQKALAEGYHHQYSPIVSIDNHRYNGLRGSGDMSWVMREQNLMDTLMKYESQLHIRWPENYAGVSYYLFEIQINTLILYCFACMTHVFSNLETYCKCYPLILKLLSTRSYSKISISCIFLFVQFHVY